jgi:hypothetical protein
MYKKDKKHMIKSMEELDLKTLIKPLHNFKQSKKKMFIKVLNDIQMNEEEIACEYACDQCGVASDDSNMKTADALRDIILKIDDDRYSDYLFRNKKPLPVEVV